jgi:hypothetical protein
LLPTYARRIRQNLPSGSNNLSHLSRTLQRRARGREIAHLFREQRGLLETRACQLDAILDDAEIEVTVSKYADPGYAAVLVRLRGGGAGILLAAQQSEGRRRFSLAHELGHFWIPSHEQAGPTLKCANTDLRARSTDSKTLEWEANDFAAELLMPTKLFAADIRHRSVSFSTVEKLASAEAYNVSRTAAAWRFVQLTKEPCALVMTENGVISWVARSRAFQHRIAEKQQPVGQGTVAAALNRGEASSGAAEKVAPYEWLDAPSGELQPAMEVFESACLIPSLHQVLSLVWTPEPDSEDEDE